MQARMAGAAEGDQSGRGGSRDGGGGRRAAPASKADAAGAYGRGSSILFAASGEAGCGRAGRGCSRARTARGGRAPEIRRGSTGIVARGSSWQCDPRTPLRTQLSFDHKKRSSPSIIKSCDKRHYHRGFLGSKTTPPAVAYRGPAGAEKGPQLRPVKTSSGGSNEEVVWVQLEAANGSGWYFWRQGRCYAPQETTLSEDERQELVGTIVEAPCGLERGRVQAAAGADGESHGAQRGDPGRGGGVWAET